MMEEYNSKWRRDTKMGSALRVGDKASLVLTPQGWRVTTMGEVHSVTAAPSVSALEEAITMTDAFHPPEGWTYKEGHWLREGWHIRPEQSGWYVYRTTESGVEKASVQEFASADRARRWAEVRFDRTGTNLRGPRPRAGRKSTCKLPDVRVTEGEKTAAMDLLKELGLTYSQFVRASIRFAADHITQNPMDEDDWVVQTDGTKASFVRVPALSREELDDMRADYRGSERSEEHVDDTLIESIWPESKAPDTSKAPNATDSSNPFMHLKGPFTYLADDQ